MLRMQNIELSVPQSVWDNINPWRSTTDILEYCTMIITYDNMK